MSRVRIVVASLTLSASALIGIAVKEHYTESAIVPTRNDRPTVGFGSTFHPDGRPVRMGDKTTPVRALITMQAHLGKDETAFRESLAGAALTQGEYDVYVDFVYQYGPAAWAKSSMRDRIMAGEYRQACDALLRYKFSGGYDCSTPGNRICSGVWTRQQMRHAKCVAEQ